MSNNQDSNADSSLVLFLFCSGPRIWMEDVFTSGQSHRVCIGLV